MLGLQKNLKEQQKFIQNSQNQPQVLRNNTLSPIQHQQFNKIAQLHVISNDIFLLQAEIHKKQQFLRQISNKVKTHYDFKAKQRQLEIKQQAVQNDLDQLITYQDRIKKELRLLSQQEQIMKGKMIVQHNKITESKQEYNSQTKRKELLNKHLEDINKGSENLRRKIKTLKQDFKKVNFKKSKIEENSLNAQVNKLANIVETKMKKLNGTLEQKQKHISPQQYSELLSKLQLLKQQCKDQQKILDLQQQLMKQKEHLEQRISFLKGVDSQFIDEKKSFIQKLSQKYSILESQRQIQSAELAKYEEQLLIIQNEQRQAMGLSKKMSKRKREAKSKQIKEQNPRNKIQLYQEKQVELQQKTVNRWKGKNLRKHCMVLMTVIGIVGLLVGSVASLYS